MPRLKNLSSVIVKIALCFAVFAAMFPSVAAASDAHVELILDASGSMYNKLDDGRYRLTAAKDVLSELVKNLPDEGLHVALRIYGGELQPDAEGACRDSRLAAPMQGVDREALNSAIQAARGRGKTPIAYSLEQAIGDFPASAERCVVVLVTDGEEVCGGDLKAAAARLKAHSCSVDLRIIGFDLDADAIRGFEGIGRFENAGDAETLADALQRAVDEVADIAPLADATLEAVDEVTAGTSFEVKWQAEEGPRDYVTIVPKDAKDGVWQAWSPTSDGNPLTLWAPIEPGEYELRYQSDRVRGQVSGRRAIRVVAAEIAIEAPSSVDAGRPFEVAWIGPDGDRDYVTLVPADAPDGQYGNYSYTRDGSPTAMHAPIKPGEYELRYQSDREAGVFARRPIQIEPASITLDAPPELTAGARFDVYWTGPNGQQDYLTIVPAGAAEGAYNSYSYTRDGSPLTLTAPLDGGEYEIRYQSDRESGVFAGLSLKVNELQVSIEAPTEVAAGAEFEASWTGPDGPGDYLTIVPADAEAGAYLDYDYTRNGSTLSLKAPEEPGDYEVRYQSDTHRGRIYARRSIRVKAP